jgi:pimeloyl-ACP methyl ester carboxylesterase/DNA-binding CsgD family transcriptional regulator
MQQRVRYATSADGVKLAWGELGRGVPLVRAATWLTHLEYDLESPVWAHWTRFLRENFRYIRYDERGCGMSDREVPDLARSTHWVDDLEAVVDAAGIDRPFVLLGISQGAATAIGYACRHPERVSRLILYGGYALGCNLMQDPTVRATYRVVKDVVRVGWGSGNPTFRQLFTSRFVPDGNHAQLDWFNELCRRTVPAGNALALMEARGNVDVRDIVPRISAPTLVLHAERDQVVPLEQGRYLAGNITDAEFLLLQSRNHVLLEHEPAWLAFKQAVLAFTGHATDTAPDVSAPALTRREQATLTLLCSGLSNAQIAWELGISEKTVRNHLSHLYEKLGVHSRAAAIVRTQGQAARNRQG